MKGIIKQIFRQQNLVYIYFPVAILSKIGVQNTAQETKDSQSM